MPELLIVAVEASADLHGAAVLRELRALDPSVTAFGAGGARLREAGCETVVRAEDLSVMGIAEVLPAIPRILRALGKLRAEAERRRPAAALLIDSPDFNLRLARRLRALGVPVVYFIGPTVWAWRTYRVRQIARDVLRMLVILPFEAAFYARHGVRASYVGNPLADRLPKSVDRIAARRSLGLDPDRPLVALLPGSRQQEIARLWEPLLGAARLLREKRPELQFVVPVAPTIDVARLPPGDVPVSFVPGRAPEVLAASDAAAVASGTASLEAALALVPTVVVYRLSWLSWWVGKLLVRVRNIALVNLLAGRAVVPELLQRACTSEAIAARIEPLLDAGPVRDEQVAALRRIRAELSSADGSGAARRAAEEVLSVLRGAA